MENTNPISAGAGITPGTSTLNPPTEVAQQSIPSVTPQETTLSSPLGGNPVPGYKKFLILGGVIFLVLLSLGSAIFALNLFKKPALDPTTLDQTRATTSVLEQITPTTLVSEQTTATRATTSVSEQKKAITSTKKMNTITLNSATYKKGFTFPKSTGSDYTSESYEWVTGKETVENWSTLITTHILSPLSPDKPLSAQAYAQNASAMNTDKGAIMIETSVINNPDAIAGGVDPKNPPYIMVYLFPSAHPENPAEPSEFGIQKIVNGKTGSVEAFIYAQRMQIKDDADLNAYLGSPEYDAIRLAVIMKAHVPRDTK